MNDPVLSGQSQQLGIVALQLLNESTIRLYARSAEERAGQAGRGRVSFSDAEFFPFFFLSTPTLLEGYPRRYWIKELAGNNYYRFLAAFSRWNDLWDAIRHVLQAYNKNALKRAGHYSELEPLLLKPDPITQYLLQSGVTLFKGMTFNDLHRLQIRIATHSKSGKRSDARKTEDRILAIALTDNDGWGTLFDGRRHKEDELLRLATEMIVDRDPDVIEGHDLFDHTLPYILRRAELHSIELSLGRDGSPVKSFSPRGNPLEADYENAIFEIAGRHVLETKALAHAFNFSKRSLEHYGLRYVTQQFGLVPHQDGSTSVHPELPTWSQQPDLVLQHITKDCHDIRSLSEHLAPSSFAQTQLVPLSFDTLLRAGSAAKIELMMLREYIRQKHSVPKPQAGSQHSGGYTEIFLTGILENVLNADIESLYPSIILTQKIRPATDELVIFEKLLKALTESRISAKRQMETAEEGPARSALEAYQSSMKVLINSFYGYLGYARGLFNDYEQADRVTSSGQEYLRAIIREVELHNGRVVEADTDGLFFIPPDNVRGKEQEEKFIQKISSSLPAGINLLLAGRYKKMLSYRKKNYALLDSADRLTIRGSALISRSLERFSREYIRLCVNCLLQEDVLGLHNRYVTLAQSIGQHRWDVYDFCRTETIHESFEEYANNVRDGKRKTAAPYEAAKRAGLLVKPGDRISYYVTGTSAGVKITDNCKLAEEWEPNFPDENTAYYMERLGESSKKFELFLEEKDFKRVFSAEDLFGFDPAGIQIVREHTSPRGEPLGADDEAGEFGIWIDEPSA